MNEQAIKDMYSIATANGYTKSEQEFRNLIQTNENALKDMYSLAAQNGYAKPIEDFQQLVGFKKKEDTESPSTDGSLDSGKSEDPESTGFLSSARNFLANINQTVYNIPADIADAWSIASAFTERQLAKAGVPGADENVGAEDIGLPGAKYRQISDEYRQMVETIAPVDEEFKSTFAGGVSQGLGQVLGMMVTGGGSKATQLIKSAKSAGKSTAPVIKAGEELIKNMGSRQGLIGGSMNASANYKQAIQEGASEEDALQFGIENLVVGSVMENLPIQSMFSRIARMEPGAKILDVIKNGLIGASEEAVTEGMQTTYENMSAQRIYDVNRSMLDGVGDAAAVGGTVGFMLNAAMSALTGRRARVASPEEKALLDKAIAETQAKINTVDQNNENIQQTINELKENQPITLRYGDGGYDFVKKPNGEIEMLDPAVNADQAQSMVQSLSNTYSKLDFSYEPIDSPDPYAPTEYRVIGKPKAEPASYSIDGVTMDREKVLSAIDQADTIDALNEIEVKNDPEIEQKLNDKKNTTKTKTDGKELLEGLRETRGQDQAGKESQQLREEELTGDAKKISELTKEAKEKDPENYWSVDEVTPEQASEGTIVSVEDGEAMGIVSKNGDIKGVVKKPDSKKKGLAQKILQKAVEAGGIKLDNFDGYLTKIYEKAGFRVVSRTPFNEEFAPEGWNKEKHGTPDVVSMVYDPEGKLNIEEKTLDNYDDALAYRDSFTDQAKKAYPTSKDKSLLNMTGKSVTVKVGGKNVSGIIDVDEGGKVTLNRGREVFELDPDTEFTEFQRPVVVDEEGSFEYKGEKFPEARIVTEGGKKKAAFIRPDKTVVAVTNPDIVEELDYQISLANTETVRQKVGGSEVEVTTSPGVAEAVVKSLDAAARTLAVAFPNVRLVVGENLQDTRAKLEAALTPVVGAEKAKAIAAGFNNDRGSAVFVGGKPVAVAVNKEVADATTAPHEIWHIVLREAFGNDPKKFQEFRDAIANELINNGFEDIAAYLDDFSLDYEGEISSEEYLAELGAQLTSRGIDPVKLSASEKTLIDRIKEVINRFAKALTGKEVFLNDATPENILQFMISVSGMIERGEDVGRVIKPRETKDSGVEVAKQKQLPARIDAGINEIIAKGKAEGKKPGEIAKEALRYVRGTDAFAKLGNRDKTKVVEQTKRLSGMRVQTKVDEYAALKDQIKLEAKAAREAVTTSRKAARSLAAKVRAMVGKGNVTQYRAAAIIKKIAATNFLSDASIDATLDYISEVFDKSNLAFKIARASDLIKPAKAALKTKIGQAKELYPVLKSLFSIDPSMVPVDMVDDYLEILDTFGARKAILDLDLAGEYMSKAESILNAIAEEQEGIIQETENSKSLKDPAQEEARGQAAINDIFENELNTSLITDPDERKIAEGLKKIKRSDVNALIKQNPEGTNNYSMVYKILQIMDNIENGYVPHQAAVILSEIQSNRDVATILPIVQKIAPKNIALGATRAVGKIKSIFTKRSSILEQVRSSPLEFIDDIFGNFNSRTIYNATFGKLASAKGTLDAEMEIVSAKLNAAERLFQSGKTDNAAVASKYKDMAYMLQREYESNPGDKAVAPAIDFIDKTIAAYRAGDLQLGSKDIQILEDIKREFSTVDSEGNPQIDKAKIENSMTANEKKAVSLIDEANSGLAGKALFTSAVIRGSRVELVNNYIHHEVQGGTAAQRVKAIEDKILAGFGGRPSTKAGTLNERTPGAKAINFDPITASYMGAKMTLTDYYMTQPLREVMKTVNKVKQSIVDNPDSTKLQIDSANALIDSLEEAVRTTFQNAFTEYSILESVIAEVRKQGYFQSLASIPRAAAELSSNFIYALKSPMLMKEAFGKFGSLANYGDGLMIMKNLGSEVSTRLYGNEALTGKFAEGGLFSGLNTGATAKSKNDVFNAISFIHKLTTRRVKNANDMIADYLLSTPDKAISRPFYFAAFAKEFQRITGEPITAHDFKKIGEGTSDLLSETWADAMKQARIIADRHITTMSASSNSFNSILKNVPRKEDTAVNSVVRAANSFMSRFYLTEYAVLRSATLSLFHSGELTKKQALVTMTAVTLRMASYVVLYQAIKNIFDIAIAQALGLEEPEEMDEEDLMYEGLRSFTGTAINTFSRRTMGNLAYMPVAWLTEVLNEKYGSELRNGEPYDAFENSLVFSGLSKEDLKKNSVIENIAKAIAGPYGPIFATASRTGVLANRVVSETSKPETKQRAIDELTTRMALEAVGQTGMIPLYKDIRRIVINDLFSDIDKPKPKSSKITKKDVEEMRKIDPETARLMEEIRKQQQ